MTAKEKCSVKITVTEEGAKVNTQELFDATTKKIWEHMVPPEMKEKVQPGQTMELISKNGCDGTTGIPVKINDFVII